MAQRLSVIIKQLSLLVTAATLEYTRITYYQISDLENSLGS